MPSPLCRDDRLMFRDLVGGLASVTVDYGLVAMAGGGERDRRWEAREGSGGSGDGERLPRTSVCARHRCRRCRPARHRHLPCLLSDSDDDGSLLFVLLSIAPHPPIVFLLSHFLSMNPGRPRPRPVPTPQSHFFARCVGGVWEEHPRNRDGPRTGAWAAWEGKMTHHGATKVHTRSEESAVIRVSSPGSTYGTTT